LPGFDYAVEICLVTIPWRICPEELVIGVLVVVLVVVTMPWRICLEELVIGVPSFNAVQDLPGVFVNRGFSSGGFAS
jgi:hypothetical protein